MLSLLAEVWMCISLAMTSSRKTTVTFSRAFCGPCNGRCLLKKSHYLQNAIGKACTHGVSDVLACSNCLSIERLPWPCQKTLERLQKPISEKRPPHICAQNTRCTRSWRGRRI